MAFSKKRSLTLYLTYMRPNPYLDDLTPAHTMNILIQSLFPSEYFKRHVVRLRSVLIHYHITFSFITLLLDKPSGTFIISLHLPVYP